jgi:predicted small integral membrane protein
MEDSLFNWMAWTLPTTLFFSAIGIILTVMTIFELYKPCIERKGFLPISTTRGDRLFIALLSSAFTHLAIIGTSDLSIWLALGLSVVMAAILLRWG